LKGREEAIDINHITQIVDSMASQPLRVLSFAYVQMDFQEWLRYEQSENSPEQVLEELIKA